MDEPKKEPTAPKTKTAESPEEKTQEKPEPKPKAAEKPAPKKNTMASNGRPVGGELPEPSGFPSWPQDPRDEAYLPDEEIDFSDLSELNREINKARARSFRVKGSVADARKEETEAEDAYRKAYNRALVGLSGGSAETRKALAEINTEDLYSRVLVSQTVVKQLINLSYAVSRDLDVLKTISDNLRKQLSL